MPGDEPFPLIYQFADRNNQALAAIVAMNSVGFGVVKHDVTRNIWGPCSKFLSRSSCVVAGVDEEHIDVTIRCRHCIERLDIEIPSGLQGLVTLAKVENSVILFLVA